MTRESAHSLVLENDALRAVLSTRGGHIEELVSKRTGGNHVWPYDPGVWPRRTSVCFPICGSLPQNRYEHDGRLYSIEPHGFLREQVLAVERADEEQIGLCLFPNAETRAVYPFAFALRIRYRLRADRLEISYEVANPSNAHPLYASIGSHHAYSLPIVPGERAEDYRLIFPRAMTAKRCHILDGLMAGPGEALELDREISVPGMVDERSLLLPCAEAAQTRIVLANRNTGSSTAVSFSGFGHCVLWAPYPAAPFVCIEPWAGMTGRVGDDNIPLERKEGILCLAPGETRRFSLAIAPGIAP